MSKTYDSLLKAQRRHATATGEVVPSEVVTQPDVTAEADESQHTILPLKAWLETGSKQEPAEQRVRDEGTLRRISISNLVADPNSLMAEQFRKLRSVITTHRMANGLRSVLVTSCAPGEGKTTVALNLANCIAQSLDDSVILVDADLRQLNLTNLLGLRQAAGLLDVLEERIRIEGTLVATETDGLTVIPGGMNPTNPAELVGSPRMRNLIQRLKEKDKDSYILIDSTPIAATSEAYLLSEMVDGVIVVILADRTRRDLVKRELNSLNQKKILGVVLNCAEFETSGYYGKHYQQYYSKKEG